MEELRLVPLSEYHADCRLLEVEPGASLEEIKQAYRDQTKIWHPDRLLHDVRLHKKAEEKIIQINLAYRRLCGLSPYEQPTPSAATAEASCESTAVFALRRALRNSVAVISKPFVWLMGIAVSISTALFQWCCRERRSLAIATSAFVLGLAFGVWLLPQSSRTWIKINSLGQTFTENHGTAQPPVDSADTSSLSPEVSLSTGSVNTSSTQPVSRASVEVFAGETNTATPIVLTGEEHRTGTNSTHHETDWQKHWLKSFGDFADLESTVRSDYMPTSFVARQNTFYYALPYNEVEHAKSKPDVSNVLPWFNQIHAGTGSIIERQQPEEAPWKPPAHAAAVEPPHDRDRSDESVTSPSKTVREDELAERKKLANQAVTKPARGRRAPTVSVIAGSAAKAVTIYAPRPDYPEEARSRHIAGSGVCVVSINPSTGSVTDASIAQSTGSLLLDKSVVRTLRTWKFKPGTVSQASIPVEFTREGEKP